MVKADEDTLLLCVLGLMYEVWREPKVQLSYTEFHPELLFVVILLPYFLFYFSIGETYFIQLVSLNHHIFPARSCQTETCALLLLISYDPKTLGVSKLLLSYLILPQPLLWTGSFLSFGSTRITVIAGVSFLLISRNQWQRYQNFKYIRILLDLHRQSMSMIFVSQWKQWDNVYKRTLTKE